ncbi:hypothetical protein [Deinococcus sp. QL22]|uniref:hypothetical protein n=1 Tax=Deinococcus sp. QL22 TaxID=2939437 RepID=UPI002017539E|nr:hypothetical protein [Deinococcus sp. QL22]UQN06522.1 hypothetical protein M1R55_00970 [Deinococcus sp. QL22]
MTNPNTPSLNVLTQMLSHMTTRVAPSTVAAELQSVTMLRTLRAEALVELREIEPDAVTYAETRAAYYLIRDESLGYAADGASLALTGLIDGQVQHALGLHLALVAQECLTAGQAA